MSKQLFTVMIETEIIVVAESQEEAEEVAQGSFRDDLDFGFMARPMIHMPAGWDDSCIVYGNDNDDESETDKTVHAWIEDGAAPKYTEMQEKLNRPKV